MPPFKKSRLSEEESSESQITQLQNLPGGEAAKMGEYASDEGPFGRAEPMEGVEFQQGPPGIPAFKKGLEQVLECQPGEELVAEVKVDGAQKVKWFKDGQPLEVQICLEIVKFIGILGWEEWSPNRGEHSRGHQPPPYSQHSAGRKWPNSGGGRK